MVVGLGETGLRGRSRCAPTSIFFPLSPHTRPPPQPWPLRQILAASRKLEISLAPSEKQADFQVGGRLLVATLRRAAAKPGNDSAERTQGAATFALELLPSNFPIGVTVAMGAPARLPNVISSLGDHFVGDMRRLLTAFVRHIGILLCLNLLERSSYSRVVANAAMSAVLAI